MKILELLMAPLKALIRFLNKLMGSEKKENDFLAQERIKELTETVLKPELPSSNVVFLSKKQKKPAAKKTVSTAKARKPANKKPSKKG